MRWIMPKKKTKKTYCKQFMDWLFHMIGYTIVFVFVTSLFSTIYIDSNHLFIWSFIIVFITYILNKTVKPILVTLTIPITGLTLGLFYPFINVFILKMVDWLLGYHFEIESIWMAFFAAILLSITNFVMQEIMKKITRKVINYE